MALSSEQCALRVAASRLTDHAAGLDTDLNTTDDTGSTLLADVLTVMGEADKDLVRADRRPARRTTTRHRRAVAQLPTGAAKATQLATALQPHGIPTGQVWSTDPTTDKGTNRRGVDRTTITQALTHRN